MILSPQSSLFKRRKGAAVDERLSGALGRSPSTHGSHLTDSAESLGGKHAHTHTHTDNTLGFSLSALQG